MSIYNDEGEIIGYRPTLRYEKDKFTTPDITTSNNNDSTKTNKNKYTKALLGISNNMPSGAINDIEFVVDSLSSLINTLSSKFEDGKTDKYSKISDLISAFDTGNTEYIDKFVNYHFGNPNGSVIPEIMHNIYKAEKRLSALESTLKHLYYGNNSITQKEAEEKDKAIIEQLKFYEKNDLQEKINYMTISFDSVLNRSASNYAFEINKKAINLAEIPGQTQDVVGVQSKINIANTLFNEINDEISYRQDAYNEQQSIEIMQKTLYNYYENRLKYNEMYNLFSNNTESFALTRKLMEYQDKVNTAIININRSFVGNQIYLSEIANLELEKTQIMKIYSDLNYKS